MDFNKRLFFDGAMGSMLQKYGMKSGEPSDMQNIVNSNAVIEVHRQYIKAGSNIITANTFGAYSINHHNADDIIAAGINHAKVATDSSENIFIAHDMGPTGKMLEPYGDFSHEDCYDTFLQSAKAGSKAKADLILIETMISLDEMIIAVQAAKTTGLPVIASMSFEKNGRTIMGSSLPDMVNEMTKLKVDAIGLNCGYGPDLYLELVPKLIELTNLPVLVQPNAGLPQNIGGKAHYSMTPEVFAESMKKISEINGVSLLGGCCGTTPDHIKEMIDLCHQ